MKEGGRSDDHSGTVLKKKSLSGCLIIKKKSGEKGVGMGGFSGSRQFFDSGKEKKRSRMILSDSESSEEFIEPVRRKAVPDGDMFRNGSAVYEKRVIGSREVERGRMRNGLGVFEFDENKRKDFYDDRLKLYRLSGDPRESGGGSSGIIVDKRKHFNLDSASNVLNAKSKSKHGYKNRYETDDDEAHLPISLLKEKDREASDEPIRVQGKNGVLKVMVNKKKKMDLPHRGYDHADVKGRKDSRSEDLLKKKQGVPHKRYDHLEAEDRKGSTSEDVIMMKGVTQPSFHSEKRPEKPIASVRMDKSEVKLRNSLSTKSSKETNDNATALKLGSPTMRAFTPAKAVKSEGQGSPPTEKITPVKDKDSKVKRGSGTEKQLLREKIRNMLLAAGWKIDYRPRRNRDYLDAVYINTSGTAYWSIIKAYEAFQKEEKAESSVKPVGEFSPLPDEILSKLTRQTRKKREREMKKKRRADGISRSAKKARVSDQQEDKLSSYMKLDRKSLKDRLNEADETSGNDSSDNLEDGTTRQDKVAKPSSGTMVQGRKSRKIGRTLVVRSSDKGTNSENDGFVPYTGKRTLLSWLIDSGTVDMSEKVQYMNHRKTRAMLEGWVTRDGIHCGCCSKILTVSKFELHAGSKLCLPFANIFLQSGKSLMQCQIDSWNKQETSDQKGFHAVKIDGNDPNDDTCGLCGDGGDLICCDGCPSTFHQSCLNIQMLPKGDWHCPNCACKFCGIAGGSSTKASGGAETALIVCHLCQKKCHESCSEGMDDVPTDCSDATISFCGRKCRELYGHLLKLLGIKHELESGFSWSLLCRSDPSSDALPLDLSQKVECNSKLAIALSVMDECFLPIVDRRSGVNLIHNVVYNCGSNFSRLNYSGFYTAILERGDEIIAAASIRIHGTQLAEMPFIGTRHVYRRQGMCRRLLSAIESALSSFKVEKLIIPAIAEHMHTWTDVFGFTPIEESHKQEMRSMNMLVFPGTDMLQKPIRKHEIPKGSIALPSDVVGEDCLEVESNKVSTVKSGLDSSNLIEINGKITGTESSSQVTPAVPSGDSSLDTACEPLSQLSSKDPIPSNSPTVLTVEGRCSNLKGLSPSDTSTAILGSGEPSLDSPVMVDRSKLSASLGLDLNTFDDTEEQEGNDTSDKVAHVDFDKPDTVSYHKESVSLDAQTDKNVAVSATDLQGESQNDASAVALETLELPVEEKVQMDGKDSESKPDMQSICVSSESAIALVTPEPSVKENDQLDIKGSESNPDLQCISVSGGSAAACETPERLVREKVQLDIKCSESKPDLKCISVSDESAVASETPELQIKENVQLYIKGSESVSDESTVAHETPEPQVREKVQLDIKGLESKPDLQCVSVQLDIKGSESVSDEIAVAHETPEPQGREKVQLDIKSLESKPDLQCVSVSNESAVARETPEPRVKENVQSDSTGSVLMSDVHCISVSDPIVVALVTPEPQVKENVQSDIKASESKTNAVSLVTPEPLVKKNVELDSKGSESEPDAVSLVTPEPLVKENVQLDGKDSESKPDAVSLVAHEPLVKEHVQLDIEGSESKTDAVSLVTLEPLVKENVQLDSNGSESNSDMQCISVVSLETPEPLIKEEVQMDSKGSESSPDSLSVSVNDASPVALETPDAPEENIQCRNEDCSYNADEANKKSSSLKLENESLEEHNPVEKENKNPNPECLSVSTEDTERKQDVASEVASNAETEHEEI